MIICADDYGLREDINQAILELCDLGKLSAVSCLVLLERCNHETLKRLLAYQSRVDVGLHLCLTEAGLPLSAPATGSRVGQKLPTFNSLFRRALLRQVRSPEIVPQVAEQYQLFVQKSGRRPDCIDGHLHLHQLPGVREGLVDFVLSLPPDSRPYVRNTQLPVGEIRRRKLPWTKAGFIGAFGSRMKRALSAAGIPTNDGFAGIYPFKKWRRYPEYLPKFADCLSQPNGILVVHPGRQEDWRRQEFESLREFPPAAGRLNRFRRAAA
jgi:hypothetical protein